MAASLPVACSIRRVHPMHRILGRTRLRRGGRTRRQIAITAAHTAILLRLEGQHRRMRGTGAIAVRAGAISVRIHANAVRHQRACARRHGRKRVGHQIVLVQGIAASAETGEVSLIRFEAVVLDFRRRFAQIPVHLLGVHRTGSAAAAGRATVGANAARPAAGTDAAVRVLDGRLSGALLLLLLLTCRSERYAA